jgi:hypothetical protein
MTAINFPNSPNVKEQHVPGALIPMPVQKRKTFKGVEEDLNWQEIVISQDEV